MLNRIWKSLRDQRGITGLETAIILIAFVVVAAVFAYTALSAGIFSAQKGSETIYSGLKQAAGAMQIKGGVIGSDTGADNDIDTIKVVVSVGVGGEAIDMTPPAGESTGIATGTSHKTIINYIDKSQRKNNLYWTKSLLGFGDSDNLLEPGEEMELSVDLEAISGATGSDPLVKDTEFTLEIVPMQGGALVITRTTPLYIDTLVNLR
ncbi:MAG: hypothetical protein HY671_02605 [Chloroflexi bacterium]|nr:hypothetical protein [Chloroflexota bacterium]